MNSIRLFQALSLLSETVSLVVVRNPFSRLVSVYFQKMIDLRDKAWKETVDGVIRLFRSHASKSYEGKMERTATRDEEGNYAFVGDDPHYAK